jgi:hypothetical protein
MKSKKVLTILLSLAIMLTFMPTMAFATDVESGDLSAAAVVDKDGAVSVTTSKTTKAVQYDTFESAITDINKLGADSKDIVVTLNKDVALTASVTVEKELKIVKGEYELKETTGKTISPANAPLGTAAANALCRKDSDTEILIVKHDAETVYNWTTAAGGGYEVLTRTVTCPNCGEKVESKDTDFYGDTLTDVGTDTITYGFYLDGQTSPVATKTVPRDEKYWVKTGYDASIVTELGQVQHKDGLPVVVATLTDGINDFEGAVTVTEATAAELAETGVVVYGIDGKAIASKDNWNVDPTCKEMGKVVYKAVVADPEGKVVQTRFLQDPQAVEKVPHVKGAFYGFKLLRKYYKQGAGSQTGVGFDTAEEAREAAVAAERVVEKITPVVDSTGKTTYVYWAYDKTATKVDGNPKTTSGSSELNMAYNGGDPLEADGSFTFIPVYYCAYSYDEDGSAPSSTHIVDEKPMTVEPLPNEASVADHTANNPVGSKFSTCTRFYYKAETVPYTYKKSAAEVVPTTRTWTLNIVNNNHQNYVTKTWVPGGKTSHINGTTVVPTKQPTCLEEGESSTNCPLHDITTSVTVYDAKLPHTAGVYGGGTPAIGAFKDANGVPLSGTAHTITVSEDKKEAVVTPTCEQMGGTYYWCTGANNNNVGHWVLKEATPATGHNLTLVTTGEWSTADATKPDFGGKKEDYIYTGTVICSNAACDTPSGTYIITYHSMKGHDTQTVKYSAIDIDHSQEKGKDCKTFGKTIYTVKGVKLRSGGDVTTSVSSTDPKTKGDHVYEVKDFNWSADYEAATVTADCSFCKAKGVTAEAEVTKSTDATGLTTFVAKFGGELGGATDTKKVYTLKGAEVTYDASKVTDGNLINGGSGYAPQTPEVTVTLNGTVIDNSELKENWYYNPTTHVVTLSVTWADDKVFDDSAVKLGAPNDSASAKTIKVAAKANIYTSLVRTLNGEVWGYDNHDYAPDNTAEIAVKAYDSNATATRKLIKNAKVKYYVTTKEITSKQSEIDKDAWATQRKIEALDFDLDSVELTEAGTYYVYAQISADGFTTKSFLADVYTINRPNIAVFIDDYTMRQGETPEFNLVARTVVRSTRPGGSTTYGDVLPLTQDDFTITSVGGQALEDLLPGKYTLMATNPNYNVTTVFEEGRVGTLTVLTKDGQDPEEEAKAAAEAADKALADANKITTAGYTADSVREVQLAKEALVIAISKGSIEEIKAATTALNAAIAKAVPLKANDMKVKTKKVKAKTSKKTSKKAVIVKKAEGKVTIKKANKAGGKKIVVKNNGKVIVKKGLKKGTYKVKVKVTAAGDATHKAKTVKKTVKVVVK